MVAEFKTICVKGSEIKSNGASLTCVEIMHQYLIRNIKIEKGANDIKSIYHWPFMNSFIWRHEAAKKWLLVFDWKLLLRFWQSDNWAQQEPSFAVKSCSIQKCLFHHLAEALNWWALSASLLIYPEHRDSGKPTHTDSGIPTHRESMI